jgi:hypothetical protein
LSENDTRWPREIVGGFRFDTDNPVGRYQQPRQPETAITLDRQHADFEPQIAKTALSAHHQRIQVIQPGRHRIGQNHDRRLRCVEPRLTAARAFRIGRGKDLPQPVGIDSLGEAVPEIRIAEIVDLRIRAGAVKGLRKELRQIGLYLGQARCSRISD